MKHSFKTRLVLFCLLLVCVIAAGNVLTWALVVNMPELSQELSAAAEQKIWSTAVLVTGCAVVASLGVIFWLIVPQLTRPVERLLDLSRNNEETDSSDLGNIDEFGSLASHLHDLRDQLQKNQDSLIKERNLLRTLIDTLPDLIYIKDSEHRFIVANAALVKHIGVESLDELLGKSDLELMPFKFASRYYEDERTVLENGEPLLEHIEPGIDLHTGAKHWFLSTKIPYYDHQGAIEGLIGIGRDITKLEQEMEALQELVSSLSWENLFLSEERKREVSEEDES